MAAQTGLSHRARTAGIIVGVLVIVILAAGFLVYLPATSVGYIPVPVVNTQQKTIVTSSISVSQPTAAGVSVFVSADKALKPLYYDAVGANLTAGTDVKISWNSSASINLYVFNSAQFTRYTDSLEFITSPNIASNSSAKGSMSAHIPATDTYYLVVVNPHSSLVEYFNVNFTTTGTATSPGAQGTATTQTITFTTSTQTVVTSTSTSTTTSTCSHNLWSWISGANSCP